MEKHLDYTNDEFLTELPEGLTVTRLTVRGCRNLKRLPEGLKAFTVDASESGITEIPASARIENVLNLSRCPGLTELPENLGVGTLNLAGCSGLRALPEGLSVEFLDITGCFGLTGWPQQARLGSGRLTARNCPWLTTLPSYLTRVAQLDLAECRNLTALPEGLEVTSWIDLAGTGVQQLPASLSRTRLRWRGVLVDARVVFHPETITGQEVLANANAEVRRVMLERMGMERFIAAVAPRVLDTDHDAGGKRQLLRVAMQNDEDLVCLSVNCPSTGRHYLLRVPPSKTNCHAAAAWIAGFDNPVYYAPLMET